MFRLPKFLVEIPVKKCWGGGWAWERWSKIKCGAMRWICAVGCTSFNFAKRWQSLSVDVVSERSNAITDNGKSIGEVRA